MGQSYIVIPGFDDMYIRVDIAKNMTPGGKIDERYILVYSEYDSIEKDIKKRSYSSIDELEANLKRLVKEGHIDVERGEIIDLKSEIANLYTDIKKNNEDTQVIAYERSGWILPRRKTGMEYLAYSDFVFCIDKTEEDKVQNQSSKQVGEVDHTFEGLDGIKDIQLFSREKEDEDTVEVPYNTPIRGISHAKDAFCYGEEWVKHDWKIDDNVNRKLKTYMTGKPKAQILFASNFNGIVYQALDLANVAYGDERTLLSVTGPTDTGKTAFTKTFKEFMFDNKSFVDNKATKSRVDDHIKQSGIMPTIYDDISTQKRSTREWISELFDLASSTGRDTQRSKGIKIYSQIIASCEEESRLSIFINKDREHQKGSKFRLLEMMVTASDFISSNEDFTDVQNMFKQTNAGILKVFDIMAEIRYGLADLVENYRNAYDVLKRGLTQKYKGQKAVGVNALINRYSEKLAVYLISCMITSHAFDNLELCEKNKIGNVLVDIIAYIEEELEYPEEYINFPDESKGYKKAIRFALKMDEYLKKWSEYLANNPNEYMWDVHIGCYATAHNGSPNKKYDKIWIPVKYVKSLCEAIDEDKDPKWIIENANSTKLSDEHKNIIKWLKKIKIRHEKFNETIIEDGSSNKLGFKKTLANQKDQYVLVFNYGTSAIRILDDLYYMTWGGTDPTNVEYDGVDEADLTEKQREIRDNSNNT